MSSDVTANSSDEDSTRHDPGAAAAAIAVADLRVLAICLFHMTGERRWLDEPFRPARDVRLIADPTAGFSTETQHEIRSAALDWLAADDQPAITDPGVDGFASLLSAFLGERVPMEYVPMIRQDMGFDEPPPPQLPTSNHDVLIIGAGVAGVCLGGKLEALGMPYRIVEKNADVGGTWFENRYPGCGVDTPNHFYSFSFAPNSHWRHFFSPRDELQAYVEDCATRFGIRERTTFDTTVTAAHWDQSARRWNVTMRGADGAERTESASIVVSATGHFNQPTPVRFTGEETFEGEIFHTARWPRDVDLHGKRVGIVGTGASSMQIVPTIVDDVESLTIFQRTPQWARPVPEYNLPVEPASQWLFDHVPFYARWYRFSQFWRYGDGLLRFLERDDDWGHPERSMNRVNDRHRQEMIDYITEKLASRPDLVEHCLPDYPPFGKRILIDNGWFDALCEPHVDLVVEPIEGYQPAGIVTSDGETSNLHELDVVILATGFNVTNLAARLGIVGRDGHELAADWADDNPSAYLGMTVPGFPNLFLMYGPNTNMGHGGSGMWLAETQTDYILACLEHMELDDLATLECRPSARDAYTTTIDDMHSRLIWTHPAAASYYRNNDGKVRSPMPFRLVDYWTMTRTPDPNAFLSEPAGSDPS